MLSKLKRWSRRAQGPAAPADACPAIEDIQENDDVSRFLCADVSEDVRRQALRTLFHKPKFNRRDGLDDYDEDYRLAHTGARIGPKRQA